MARSYTYIEEACARARARGLVVAKLSTAHGGKETWLARRRIADEVCHFYDAGTHRKVFVPQSRLAGTDRIIVRVLVRNKSHFIGLPTSLLARRFPAQKPIQLWFPEDRHGAPHPRTKHGIRLWDYENQWTTPRAHALAAE